MHKHHFFDVMHSRAQVPAWQQAAPHLSAPQEFITLLAAAEGLDWESVSVGAGMPAAANRARDPPACATLHTK